MSNPNHDSDGRFASGSGLRDQIKQAMSYSEAKAKKDQFDKIAAEAGAKYKSLSDGKGLMGLTSDATKATPEWKQAKSDYERAFANQRAYNEKFLKTYAKEYRAERAAKRGG